MTRAAQTRLLEGMDALRLALDPELAQRAAEWQEQAENERYLRSSRTRTSGWRKGPPQCPGCRRVLKGRDGFCESCGTLAGRHDHGR
jgi:rRNA maturation endonuclease Nob1